MSKNKELWIILLDMNSNYWSEFKKGEEKNDKRGKFEELLSVLSNSLNCYLTINNKNSFSLYLFDSFRMFNIF
jgi:hypothetical protein